MIKRQTTHQKALVIEAQSTESSNSDVPLFFNFNVETKHFDDQDILALLARELHAELQVGRDFSTWIKDRISKNNFVENQDFILVFTNSGENPKGGRPTKEYWITIDMAKHLCMLENNKRGHQIRRYFIDIERRYYESKNANIVEPKSSLKYSLKFIADETAGADFLAKYVGLKGNQAILSTSQMIRKTYDVDILILTGQTKGLVSESQQHDFSPTEIGGMLKPIQSARKVNQMLIELGYQIKAENPKLKRVIYQPTQLGESFAILKDTLKKHSDGTPILQLRWFENIVDVLQFEIVI